MPFGTLRPSRRIRGLKDLVTTACLITMILALTGCGYLPFVNKDKSQSPVPTPPKYSESAEQLSPQAVMEAPKYSIPKGYTQVQAATPPPELSPPIDPIIAAGPLQLSEDSPMGALGVNLEEYFDKSAPLEERVNKVERAVNAIQKDLSTLAPPIKRLITVERDIQSLVAQLAEFVQTPPAPEIEAQKLDASMYTGSASPSNSIYAAGKPMAVTNSLASRNVISGGSNVPYQGNVTTVKKLRIGEHKDKTRIVLDTSTPTGYRYDLDNTEQILVIELSGASWSGKTEAYLKKSPLIASYKVHAMPQGGNRVVVQLKKSTSIKYEGVIKANGYKDYRIVLDLKK